MAKSDGRDRQASAGQETGMALVVDGKKRRFDVDDPKLPGWVKDAALGSGGYPYAKKLDKDLYKAELTAMQVELVKLQSWLQSSGERVMVLFEGRDAAGKGGTIFVLRQYMNPRTARNVALAKPTDTEQGQLYYQRYVSHFPTRGELVTFDRSWYNRGVVEPVMGFSTEAQTDDFLEETPHFEALIVRDGIRLFKFWLNIGQEMQLKRFHDRRHDPLKVWKFSPIDIAGMSKWDEYTRRRDAMIAATHTRHAPWTVVRANDKRRARLAVIRRILLSVPYEGRDLSAIGTEDAKIIGEGPDYLRARG